MNYVRWAMTGALAAELALLLILTLVGLVYTQSILGVVWSLEWAPALTPLAVLLGAVGGACYHALRNERGAVKEHRIKPPEV